MSLSHFQQAAEKRRSVYTLNRKLPVSVAEVVRVVEHAIRHTPSSFNSQSTRLVILLGSEHEKLWNLAEQALAAIVPADKFQPTREKLAGFAAAAGTVLFFEDQLVVKSLQEQFAQYADNFPVWAEHADAMHQYAIWTALASIDVGASLQHYNPVIDEPVAKAWNVPASWKLRAQLVFGGIVTPAGEKSFAPVEDRLKVYGL
ncbi:MAG: nitroreductase family protein [Lautropia sp.]|nr:nitroreductase family protein [Lautropia sp.]